MIIDEKTGIASIGIVYHNVKLVMYAFDETERFKLETYRNNVISGTTKMNLPLFSKWCRAQGVSYDAWFEWLRNYPVTANIWNYLIYRLWKIQNWIADRREERGQVNL